MNCKKKLKGETDINLPINDPNSTVNVADWVELMIASGELSVSREEVISALGSEELNVEDVWRELEKRVKLYRDISPFRIDSAVIETCLDALPEDQKNVYLMFMLLAYYGNDFESDRSGELFELVSVEAIRSYISGEAERVSSPSDFEPIVDRMCEGPYNSPPAPFQDGGIDAISWKPFGDGRSSQIILLVQCAAGYNWKLKLGDVSAEAWMRHLNSSFLPTRGFTLPHAITRIEELKECSSHAGILMDRPRLMWFLPKQLASDLASQIKEWCRRKQEYESG